MKKLIPIFIGALLGSATITVAKPPSGPGNGPPSHAEFMQEYDTNGDGKLSKAEKQAARDTMESQGMRSGGPPEEVRERMLERFDADGDGKLTGEERREAKKAIRQKMAVHHFDKDGDGQLNDEEKAEARAFYQQRKQERLEQFDEDGDGRLSAEEKQNARETMRESGERFGPPPSKGKGQGKGPQGPPPPPFLDEDMDEEA